jgi:hypothetical protein
MEHARRVEVTVGRAVQLGGVLLQRMRAELRALLRVTSGSAI